MRILIQNYSNDLSTEAMYFAQAFRYLENLNVSLWENDNVSTFDKMDSFAPDVLVIAHQKVNNDLIKYLVQNSDKQIKMVVNTTGSSEEAIVELTEVIHGLNLICPFFFTNEYKFLNKNKNAGKDQIKTVNILPAADLFIPINEVPDYKIEAAIIATQENVLFDEACKEYNSYHKLKLGSEGDKNFDMPINAFRLHSLYNKYNEIVLADHLNVTCSQLFFDGFLNANKLVVKTAPTDKETFNMVLAELFHEEDPNASIVEKIKEQIKSKHTCFQRSAQFLRELGEQESSERLLEIAGKL